MSRLTASMLSVTTALALTAGAAAQSRVIATSKAEAPVKYFGTYRVSTGEWSRGVVRAGTRVLYNSQSPSNYFATVGNTSQTAADQAWIDEGVLADENGAALTQIDGFDFGYCSADLEPLGNQCSIGISFYDDYIPCSTPSNAPTCAYVITGLPCSISGNTECWAVSVDLAGGAECTAEPASMFRTFSAVADPLGNVNGNFGWGFVSNPGISGRNDTGPILGLPCPNPVGGCVGGSLQGNQNAFWWEDPTAIWTGCYWFGGVPWASFDMKILGPEINSYAYYSALCSNTMVLRSTAASPGSVVTWTASNIPATSSGVFLLSSLSRADSPILGATQCLLVGPFTPLGPLPMAGGVLALGIPPGAAGLSAHTQAVSISGSPVAANVDGASNGLYHPFETGSGCSGGFNLVPSSQAVYQGAITPDFYPRMFVAPGSTVRFTGDEVTVTPPEDPTTPFVYGAASSDDFALYQCATSSDQFEATFSSPGGYVVREIRAGIAATTSVFVGVQLEEMDKKKTKTGKYKKFTPHVGDVVYTDVKNPGQDRRDYFAAKGANVKLIKSVADLIADLRANPKNKVTIANHATCGQISIGGGVKPTNAQAIGKDDQNNRLGSYSALVDPVTGIKGKLTELCLIGCGPGDGQAGCNLADCLAADLMIPVKVKKGSVYYSQRYWLFGEWTAYAIGGEDWKTAP